MEAGEVFAYEALVRGPNGEPASSVLGALKAENLYRFDCEARSVAVRLAASLGLRCGLSLNFLPRTLDAIPDGISSTLQTASECGLPAKQVILEVTEGEIIADAVGFAAKINSFRSLGVRLAIDDFGAGYAGLNLLADFQPDIVKLDMALIRDIDSKGPRQAIARAVLQVCHDLGLDVIAEGVETEAEFRWLRRRGVSLFQGYFFAKPAWGRLAIPNLISASRIT
jgi:EAL domain-containing protein (putative c-di-GMP-specific phosphodiesterase class I)